MPKWNQIHIVDEFSFADLDSQFPQSLWDAVTDKFLYTAEKTQLTEDLYRAISKYEDD